MITSFRELSVAGKILTLAFPVVVTIGLAVRAADLARLDRIEERQFTMQGVAVTDSKLSQTKGEIVQLMDIRFVATNSKIDLISQQQDRMIDIQQKSNEYNKQIIDELRRSKK
jgi:hypothetical protein